MAGQNSVALLEEPHPVGEDDSLDEEVEQLLRDAEARLRAKHSAAQHEGDSTRPAWTEPPQLKLPQLRAGNLPQPYVNFHGKFARADSARLVDSRDRQMANRPRIVEDPVVVKKRVQEEKKATSGPDWFNLPRTDVTPELQRDLQILRMRSVLDPKRHYKKDNGSKKSLIPQFSQVGTVIEGPTEFSSGRIPNKQRKKTFVEEVLARSEDMDRFKCKYNEVQVSKASGKKGYYKQLKAKRRKKYG